MRAIVGAAVLLFCIVGLGAAYRLQPERQIVRECTNAVAKQLVSPSSMQVARYRFTTSPSQSVLDFHFHAPVLDAVAQRDAAAIQVDRLRLLDRGDELSKLPELRASAEDLLMATERLLELTILRRDQHRLDPGEVFIEFDTQNRMGAVIRMFAACEFRDKVQTIAEKRSTVQFLFLHEGQAPF